MATFSVAKTARHIKKAFRMAGWTFIYGMLNIRFEHMATILTPYDIIPEMNRSALNGQ